MYIVGQTLDDLLHRAFSAILKSGKQVFPSRGECREAFGALLTLKNPRARLSRTEGRGETLFSALGELLWYLSGSNELKHIHYYIKQYAEESDNGRTIHGAYGPRLFRMHGGIDQISNAIELLKKNNESRRAVIQIFDAADIAASHKEIPCTCSFQFAVRRKRLQMITHMRSNDAFKGLPHDIFAFTMLQELVARSLNIEPGDYRHSVASLHIYKSDYKRAQQFIEEGWQSTESTMPSMPIDDPWDSVEKLVTAERSIRKGNNSEKIEASLDPYWADMVRLLAIFRAFKDRDKSEVRRIRKRMSSTMFDRYIERKQVKAGQPIAPTPAQHDLFDGVRVARRKVKK